MKTGVVIRWAAMADFAGVSKIFAEENRFHAELVPHAIRVAEPVMTRAWFEGVLADPAQALLVAQLGAEVAGVLLAALRTGAEDPILQPRRLALRRRGCGDRSAPGPGARSRLDGRGRALGTGPGRQRDRAPRLGS